MLGRRSISILYILYTHWITACVWTLKGRRYPVHTHCTQWIMLDFLTNAGKDGKIWLSVSRSYGIYTHGTQWPTLAPDILTTAHKLTHMEGSRSHTVTNMKPYYWAVRDPSSPLRSTTILTQVSHWLTSNKESGLVHSTGNYRPIDFPTTSPCNLLSSSSFTSVPSFQYLSIIISMKY